MGKTIAISERVYVKLKELKEALGIGYSDLIEKLIEVYERVRREELRNISSSSKLSNEEVTKIREVIKNLRERQWW